MLKKIRSIFEMVTPLFAMFLICMISAIATLTDPGEEGWGIMAGIITFGFSMVILLMDLILKKLIKPKRIFWTLQFVLFVVLLYLIKK